MSKVAYSDEWVTLYHGDCLDCEEWLDAGVLVTDPPYGIGWKRSAGTGDKRTRPGDRTAPDHKGISGDKDTSVRDKALELWAPRPGLVFGSFDAPPPENRKQTLVWRKWANSGVIGSVTGWRRDVEPIYIIGDWPKQAVRRSGLLTVQGTSGGKGSASGKTGHPHAKPLDIMGELIRACPPGVIADPFAGSCSTLVAARDNKRRCIGVEVDSGYVARAVSRLCQLPLAA